jgi:hypothetical protein
MQLSLVGLPVPRFSGIRTEEAKYAINTVKDLSSTECLSISFILLFQNQRVFCELESIASILLVVFECFWYVFSLV